MKETNSIGILNEDERGFYGHMVRWGSDCYPVQKMKGKWFWLPFRGVQGSPATYRTKREAVAAVESYLDSLRDKLAGRLIKRED